MRRIGIFSGSFDPVHKGHIALVLKATTTAKLDKVYFAPEAKPRRKEGVTHIAHRLAMLKLATRSHSKLGVLELPDKQFSPAQTLPRLQQKFPGDELVLIIGVDMLEHMPEWPLIKSLLKNMELLVATRGQTTFKKTSQLIEKLPFKPKKIYIVTSPEPELSSRKIREAIASGQPLSGTLASINRYIKVHWLYSSPASSVSSTSSS